MKTKICIRVYLLLFALLIHHSPVLNGQTSKLDSIISSKQLQLLNGSVPTYYASHCKTRATESQALLQKLVVQYFTNTKNSFNLKLAVIDSTQWSGFNVPYGFFFINQNWIVIPGDLDFQKFSRLWGFTPQKEIIKKNLKKESKNPESLLTDALYGFCVMHELGHYYTRNILNASAPDRWTSELTASYFTTDYLFKNDKKLLKAFSIFTSTFYKEYKPKYITITDFNTKYSGVGLENYVWYNCAFQQIIEEIYAKYKGDFLISYAKEFPRISPPKKYTQEELLKILDSLSSGITTKWVKLIESKS
jgi:hypothetical protein